MKKKLSMLSLLGAVAVLIVGAIILSSCEGPEGPPGEDGIDGLPGANGQDGQDGQDANSTCILCHSDDQTIVTKSRQHANSGHSNGHSSGYTNRAIGPDYNCAGCHTSQGFLDNLQGVLGAPYSDITQPNCYTCHNIHDTYTEADWALTLPGVNTPLTGSPGIDLGNGNQCVNCHQMTGRYLAIDSLWANFDDGGLTTVTITSGQKRAGVHHGPQLNILAGMDLFEFSGSSTYPTSNHVLDQAPKGCVTCHMNDGFGDLTGHSMSMTYDWHGAENYHWNADCEACHDGSTAEELDDKTDPTVDGSLQNEIQLLLDELYTILTTAGIMFPEGVNDEYLMVAGTWTTNLTAAHLNYNAIREDRSLGFHNPDYIRAVLENTIESLTP